MRWIVNDLEDLRRVAGEFLAAAGERRVFALEGPMGVGKTTFVKAVAEALGVEDEVTSPEGRGGGDGHGVRGVF